MRILQLKHINLTIQIIKERKIQGISIKKVHISQINGHISQINGHIS